MHQLLERAALFSPELQHSLLSPSSPTVTPPRATLSGDRESSELELGSLLSGPSLPCTTGSTKGAAEPHPFATKQPWQPPARVPEAQA